MEKGIVYSVDEIKDFRKLIERTVKRYPENIAYQFKEDIKAEKPCYKEIPYKQVKEDVQKLGTALLEMGLENKKVYKLSRSYYSEYGNCSSR